MSHQDLQAAQTANESKPIVMSTQAEFRRLPAMSQIRLALQHRGYRISGSAEGPLQVALLGQQGVSDCKVRLRYLESLPAGSQSQLLEMLLPLNLHPDQAQLDELAPLLAQLNGSLYGLALVANAEGLCLRACTLHPRQLPDLRSLLRLFRGFVQAWSMCYSLLAPYIGRRVPFERLLSIQPA